MDQLELITTKQSHILTQQLYKEGPAILHVLPIDKRDRNGFTNFSVFQFGNYWEFSKNRFHVNYLFARREPPTYLSKEGNNLSK